MTATLVNLTEALTQACADLRKMKRFKGAYVHTAKCSTIEERRKDALSDQEHLEPGDAGYQTPETIEEGIRDYVCVSLDIDYSELYEGLHSNSEFVGVEFDYLAFENAFKDWLLPYLGGDKSLLPNEIRFDFENEFFRELDDDTDSVDEPENDTTTHQATRCSIEGDEIVIRIPKERLVEITEQTCLAVGEIANLDNFANEIVSGLSDNGCADIEIMVSDAIESLIQDGSKSFISWA